MPSLDEVYELATSLGGTPVTVDESRCVVVRHRKASCRRCVGVCPVNAVEIQLNRLKIDFGTCIGCGACSQVCPTEALVPNEPPEDELLAAIDAQAERGREIVFACARKDATREGDPAKTVVVPCLARLGERTLMHAAALADGLTLVDGQCATCKYRACEAAVAETVAQVEALVALTDHPVEIRLVQEYPESVKDDGSAARAAARRGFFTDSKSLALEAATKAFNLLVEEKLPGFVETKKPPTTLERLGMAKYGQLPRFDADRNLAVADALEAMGLADEDASVECRLFASFDVRTTECNGCSMCETFCPTRALQWGFDADGQDAGEPDASGKLSLRPLEFSAIDCVACGLCVDVCPVHCIELGSVASLRELFDFEPETYLLPPAPAYSRPLFTR